MATLVFTPVGKIPGLCDAARATFDAGRTRPVAWRLEQLRAIKRILQENREAIVAALRADLGRPEMECVIAEILVVIAEVDHAMKHMKSWMQPRSVVTPAVLAPGSSYVQPDPLGVVCIIAPWNFPLQLIFNPLIAAIAAGNAAVIKPSEVSVNCAILAEQLINRYMDTSAFKVVQGAVPETTTLLEQRFDHILYTGNGVVAAHIMRAAARHLTPVTLELGGKSPVIVDKDADLDTAAKRIVTNKCLNAGQVCLSPDYILVHKDVQAALLSKLSKTLRDFYGEDMAASPDLGRIISTNHFNRLCRMLATADGEVVIGGQTDAGSRYVAPTIILSPRLDSPVMTEEIFGPLLPVLPVASVDEAVAFINARPKPLALYVFTGSSRTADAVLARTSSGGAVVNDAVVHNANPDLPFGGVGPSGMGAYHGQWGFDRLSHLKAVFKQPTWIDMGKLRYPPYSAGQLRWVERLINSLPPLPSFGLKDVVIAGLGAAVAALGYKLHKMGGFSM